MIAAGCVERFNAELCLLYDNVKQGDQRAIASLAANSRGGTNPVAKRTIVAVLGLLTILSLVVSSCAPSPTATPEPTRVPATKAPPTAAAAPAEPTVYRIGLGVPLTGDLAMYGVDHLKAAEMAVEEINAVGGVDGVPVELVVEDDLCSGEGYIRVLTKLSAQGIPIYCTGFCSSAILNACPRAQELGIVLYAHGSNPRIATTCGDYTFQTWGNDSEQGKEQANLAEWLGVKEAAMVYTNNDYGIGVKDAFVEAFEAKGGKILTEVPVMQDGTDFRTEIAKLKALNPKFTVFEMYGPPGAIFLKQAVELGFETQFIGDLNWAEMASLELAGEAAEGIISLRSGSPADTPEAKNFLEAFEAQHGHSPAMGSNQTYDQIMLAIRAIKLGGYTADGIRDVTMKAAEDYVGASGPKKMTEQRYAMYVFEWTKYENGKVVPLKD